MNQVAHQNPLLVNEVLHHVMKYVIEENSNWKTNLSQLFMLRSVCSVWSNVIDVILKEFDSLSLLPHPYVSLSQNYYVDSLHASLFHLNSNSCLGSPYFYSLFDKGRVKSVSILSRIISHFPKLKYLSIVQLNKDILNLINQHMILLEGLAFDTLDEENVTENDLKNCCFNRSLKLISFSYFINKNWILKFFKTFESLEIVHFSVTPEPYIVPFEVLNSIGSNVKAVYLGNQVATFEGPYSRDSLVKSDDFRLNSLEILSSSTLYYHQQECLLKKLSSFKFLSNLHLDISKIDKVAILKLVGKMTSLTTLKLVLPTSKNLPLILPLEEMVNSDLEQLVLVGNIEFPVVKDSQLIDLSSRCPKMTYLCINSLIYTVNDADEYMSLLMSLSYLKHLHIGYRPLLEEGKRLENKLIQLSKSFDSFKLIYWCNESHCKCLEKNQLTVHQHYCNCSYYVSQESKILFNL